MQILIMIPISCEFQLADVMTCRFAGTLDAAELLSNLEVDIINAKKEVASRKDILILLERWMSACEEEGWLEDYNKVCGSLQWIIF